MAAARLNSDFKKCRGGERRGKERCGVVSRGAAHVLWSRGNTGSSGVGGKISGPGTFQGAVATPPVIITEGCLTHLMNAMMALDLADSPVSGGLAVGTIMGTVVTMNMKNG